MTDFTGVVESWKQADVEAIHPLRATDEQAYWESGEAQANEAGLYIPDGGTVIDFGCGDGRLSIPLAELGFDVLAIDASEQMLARVKQRAADKGVHVDLMQSDGLDLPMLIDPVDTVVCRAVLIHHSHADVARLVKSLAGVIKPGGHLVADWPLGKHHERRDWIDVTTWKRPDRDRVAAQAGLTLVEDGTPGVWQHAS